MLGLPQFDPAALRKSDRWLEVSAQIQKLTEAHA
jgi:hypothetical protein